jgi:hypothetical protein
MPKEMLGKPNIWANNFYRLIEDFVYGIYNVDQLRSRLKQLTPDNDFIESLIDSMINPPPIDYTED